MKNSDDTIIDILFTRPIQEDIHISRGVILSGVLDGTANYEAITPYTDGDSGALDSDVEYDPNADQRLDKFDALEEGYQAIDNHDVKTMDTQPVEKKE